MSFWKIFLQGTGEFFLLFFYPLFGWIDAFLPSTDSLEDGDRPVVVMVERWMSPNPMHRYRKRYLEKRGFRVYLHNFPLAHGSFAHSAKALARFIEERNITKCHLIGISNGGITALLYLQNEHGWEHVSKCFMLASPFFGTPLAYLLFFLRSGKELFPKSSLGKEILGIDIVHKEKLYCLQPFFDELVPVWSSSLPGVQTVLVHVIGHNNFHVASDKTYRKIVEIINNSSS